MKVKKITKPTLEGDTYHIAQAVNHNAEVLEKVLNRVEKLEEWVSGENPLEIEEFIKSEDMTREAQEPTLDKLRAEIEAQEKWLAEAGYNAYNVGIAFFAIKHALGK